jgi:hypothetical protein
MADIVLDRILNKLWWDSTVQEWVNAQIEKMKKQRLGPFSEEALEGTSVPRTIMVIKPAYFEYVIQRWGELIRLKCRFTGEETVLTDVLNEIALEPTILTGERDESR